MQFSRQNLQLIQAILFLINKDIVTHNVTEDTAQNVGLGDIVVDSSWRLVPKNDFNYLCSIHPTMKGSVTINK